MIEREVGSGGSLKDGMLFGGNEMKGKARCREKRDAEVWLKAYKDGFAAERKRKKILQKPGKDVHWFPLIAYGQVL